MTKRGEPMRWLSEAVHLNAEDCIPWPFSCDPKGYGRVYDPTHGQPRLATHLVLEMSGVDRPSPAHWALHSCDNPPCVNRRHLRWGVASDNTADMVRRGRQSSPTKLTDEQVRQIRAMRGVMQGKDVAALFGVSRATVSEIQLRHKRKDVA